MTTPVPFRSVCLYMSVDPFIPSRFHFLQHRPCQRLVSQSVGGSFENRSIQPAVADDTTSNRPTRPLTTGADAPSHRAILRIPINVVTSRSEMAKSFHKFYFAHPLAISTGCCCCCSPGCHVEIDLMQTTTAAQLCVRQGGSGTRTTLRMITECAPWFSGGGKGGVEWRLGRCRNAHLNDSDFLHFLRKGNFQHLCPPPLFGSLDRNVSEE